MFLFLLEHVPAGPCGCASGNHEVRIITDITLSFHHFHAGDLLSFTGWANTPTRILVLLREYGAAAAAAKSLQSCLTLCDPIDGSPPGSPVPGILQARTLVWAAISFSNA